MTLAFKNLSIPTYIVILISFSLLMVIFGYMFYETDITASPKLSTTYGSLASAFAVAIVQLLASVYEAIKLRKFEKMGIRQILPDRRNPSVYETWIKNSNEKIHVMGVTANRLLSDFGKSDGKSKVLLEALARGVDVKILIANKKNLFYKKQSDDLENLTIPLAQGISSKNFQLKYFDHPPAHSIFIVDDLCVVGPVFQHIDSKDTPALVLNENSEFARPYIETFDREWKQASDHPQ